MRAIVVLGLAAARAALPWLLLASSVPAAAADELNILSWEGYADDSFVKPFEKQSGCKVSATYVGSIDEFVAKILSGGGAYDLVTPSNDTTMRLIDSGAVEAIDVSKVPNMADFFDLFKAAPWVTRNGRTYGVPYGWGIVRIIVDRQVLPNPPDSLALLWDPRLKGKVSIWDDVEAIYTAARYLGFKNTYDLTDEQLEKVKPVLIALKPNIRKYWATTGEMGTLMAQHEVAAGNSWESTLADLWKAGRDVVDVPVKEGRGGWADSWMIVKGAASQRCVYAWLDYVSSPKAQAVAHKVTGYGYSNRKMAEQLDPATRAQYERLGMTAPKILEQVDWWQNVRRRARYLEVWNQVKAQ
jgi:putative spermidine/putrescine transport system substrate-binding protein/spermidine/putrescine transport system substrate-binding protein